MEKHINFGLLACDDVPDMLDLFSEKSAFVYIPRLKNQTKEFYLNFLHNSINKIKSNEAYYWVMRDGGTNDFIGAINLNKIVDSEDMQIGWQVKERFRGQGFAYLGAKYALEFAICSTQIVTIYGVFDAENIASQKILQKLKFSLNHEFIENENTICKYIYQIDR